MNNIPFNIGLRMDGSCKELTSLGSIRSRMWDVLNPDDFRDWDGFINANRIEDIIVSLSAQLYFMEES